VKNFRITLSEVLCLLFRQIHYPCNTGMAPNF